MDDLQTFIGGPVWVGCGVLLPFSVCEIRTSKCCINKQMLLITLDAILLTMWWQIVKF